MHVNGLFQANIHHIKVIIQSTTHNRNIQIYCTSYIIFHLLEMFSGALLPLSVLIKSRLTPCMDSPSAKPQILILNTCHFMGRMAF